MCNTRVLAALALATACGGGGDGGGAGDAGADEPRLVLASEAKRIRVVTGGFTEVEVSVTREGGLEGDVELSMSGLPALVSTNPVVVAAGATSATLVVTAGPAAEHAGPVPVTVAATSLDRDDVNAELMLPAFVAGPPGSPDESFSFDGEVIYKLSTLEQEVVRDAALDGEGRLLVAGFVSDGPSETEAAFVGRLLRGGSLDPDFADSGVGIGDPDLSPSGVLSLVAAPSGQTIHLVRSTDVRLARKALDSGDLDGTFAGTGAFQFGSFSPRELAGMNGGFLAFNASAVRTFDHQGNERAGFESADLGFLEILSAAEDPDGRILLGLRINGGPDTAEPFHIARLEPSGALDLDFGEDGYALAPLPAAHETALVLRIALDDDGGGVAFAMSQVTVSTFEASAVRFTAGGDPVADFGNGGRRVVEPSAQLGDVILEPNGKVVVLAFTSAGSRIWRYQADGQPDAGWGEDGVITIAQPRQYRRLVHDREADRVILVGEHLDQNAITATRLWL